MSHDDERWVPGSFGLDADRAATMSPERTVLAVVHHMTAATRLADVMPLLESDRRVQVVYTCPPAPVSPGWTREYLGRLGATVIPWQQAVETGFDLAVAASYGNLERVHAPVLTLPHGAGFNKYARRWEGPGPEAGREMYGMERAVLVYRGRVIPSAVVVPTGRDLARLRRGCPEAAAVGVMAGDPAFDRLAASMALRERYRRALGATDRALVAISSTWGTGSLLRQCPDLIPAVLSQLPQDRFRVAAILHPNIWAWHGRRQVRAWFSGSMRDGVILIPPEEGWRAVLVAADYVLGDHGSVTCYAAAIGRPVLLASFPAGEVDRASAVARLGRMAPRLDDGVPLEAQLERAAATWTPARHRVISGLVTGAPGRSAELITAVMYRLMGMVEPAARPAVRPVPVPRPLAVPE